MIASVLSLLLSLVTPVLLEWLKREPWMPVIQPHQPKINAVVAAVVAVSQVVGISFAFDATAGTLTIGGLVLSDMARIGVTALLAWVFQEVTYRTRVRQ